LVKIIRDFSHKILWAKHLLTDAGLLYLLKQIPEALFLKRNFYILVYELNRLNIKTNKVSLPGKWLVVNNDFKSLDLIRKKNPNLPTEFFFDKIDGCCEFFMTIVDSNGSQKPVSICWLYNNQYTNRVIRLKPDEIEIKHVITLTEFRNTGIFSNMLEQVMLGIHAKGYKRVVSLIEVDNKPSIIVFQKYGFSIIKKWSFRKVMGLQVSPLFSTSQR